MSETAPDIVELFRQVQAAQPIVQEFAFFWLDRYRRDTESILAWHWSEGRTVALRGEDPDPIRHQTEERLAAARLQLRDRLSRLLAWAAESGRLSR